MKVHKFRLFDLVNLTRTRYAPTPSGYLHPGNVLSFALTAALAEKYGCRILLRVDDIDQLRVIPEFRQDVFDTLRFLELPWDEGPIDQSSLRYNFTQKIRMPLYEKALADLVKGGHIYACECSRSRTGRSGCAAGCDRKSLDLGSADVSWRVQTRHLSKPVQMRTLSGTIEVSLDEGMRDFVVRRRDGIPAYQLCTLVDDLYFGVDLVVRGSDLFESTVAQLCLASLLQENDFAKTTFVHHRLLLRNGKKLSKSGGATSVRHMRSAGMSPAGIYNEAGKMAGLGGLTWWNDKRIFDLLND